MAVGQLVRLGTGDARIDERGEGFEEDGWQYETRDLGSVMEAPLRRLRQDRRCKDLGWQGDDPDLCSSARATFQGSMGDLSTVDVRPFKGVYGLGSLCGTVGRHVARRAT